MMNRHKATNVAMLVVYVLAMSKLVMGAAYVILYTCVGAPRHGILVNSVPMALETAMSFTLGSICFILLTWFRIRECDLEELQIVNHRLAETLAKHIEQSTPSHESKE